MYTICIKSVFFIFLAVLCVDNVGSYGFFERISYSLGFRCNDYGVPKDIHELQRVLQKELFGQHIATETIVLHLEAHLTDRNPTKPLVMSFHGSPGIGKNHVAYMIANSLYDDGINSPFYHYFLATKDFPLEGDVKDYKFWLRQHILITAMRCQYSLFVFDEADKMPYGVIDALKPFLDNVDNVDGVDFRRAIFIFLSNTGGMDINNVTLSAHKSGTDRARLTTRDFEQVLARGAFNERAGLGESVLIRNGLIDVYVPFLPLGKSHVRLCAEREFGKQSYIPQNKEKALKSILDETAYYPGELGIYSRFGCRGVDKKVSFFITADKKASRYKTSEL